LYESREKKERAAMVGTGINERSRLYKKKKRSRGKQLGPLWIEGRA